MIVTFICGCTTREIIARENLKTMDSIGLDEEGFLHCRIHDQRRRGWRTVPYAATSMARPEVAGMSPLQYEAFVLYGEMPLEALHINLKSDAPDTRDARNPIAGGHALMELRRQNPNTPLHELADRLDALHIPPQDGF